MKVTHILQKIPRFIDYSLLVLFRQDVQKIGVQKAAQEFLERVGVKNVEVIGKLPRKGPHLIISNHPSIVDTFTLLSLFKEKNFFFTALSTYEMFGLQIQKQLLPIFRQTSVVNEVFEFPLHLEKNFTRDILSFEEVRQKNRKSISAAARLLSQGNIVSIFPMGPVGKKTGENGWKKGVGYLIKQVKNPQTCVSFVKIQEGGTLDVLRILQPWLRKILMRETKKTVFFSHSHNLQKLIQGCRTEQEIVEKLEEMYEKFSEKITKKTF